RSASKADRLQIAQKLRDEPWIDAATFTAYSTQIDALHLQPWQSPPCEVQDVAATLARGDDGVSGDYQAALLLQRMLKAGLSRYEPDPLHALEQTESTKPTPPTNGQPPT